jgi:hypothetical protein
MVITQSFYNLPRNQKINIDTDNLDGRIKKIQKKNLPGQLSEKTIMEWSSSIRQFSQIWLSKITRKKGEKNILLFIYFWLTY